MRLLYSLNQSAKRKISLRIKGERTHFIWTLWAIGKIWIRNRKPER